MTERQNEGTTEHPHVYGRGTRLSTAYTHGRDGLPCPKWAAEPGSKAREAWLAGKQDRKRAGLR